jgi:hypothetical protein
VSPFNAKARKGKNGRSMGKAVVPARREVVANSPMPKKRDKYASSSGIELL